jgi:hypothetical protein
LAKKVADAFGFLARRDEEWLVGLCIELQSEFGERHEFLADESNLLGRKLLGYPDPREFPMLASIDYYGNTTFNRMQIERFLEEWETLFAKATTPEEFALLDAVRRLGQRTRETVHQYLVFIGD